MRILRERQPDGASGLDLRAGMACSAPRMISPIWAPQKIESAKSPDLIGRQLMPAKVRR